MPSGDGGSPPRSSSQQPEQADGGASDEDESADVMEVGDAEAPAEAVTAVVLVLPATFAAATPEVAPPARVAGGVPSPRAAAAVVGRGATFHDQCRARVCAALAAAAADTMPPRQGDVFPPARYPALVLLQDGRRLRAQSRRSAATQRFPTLHRMYRIAVQAESPAGWRSSAVPAPLSPVEEGAAPAPPPPSQPQGAAGDVRWAALRLLMEGASVSAQRRAALRSNSLAGGPLVPPSASPNVAESGLREKQPVRPASPDAALETAYPDLAVAVAVGAPTSPVRKGLQLLMLAAVTPVAAAV
jgi:hypothetical protein